MYMTKIRNESEADSNNQVRDIYIYSVIEHNNFAGISATKLLNELQNAENLSQIVIHINSEGGDMFESIAIYNLLKSLNIDIQARVEGLCASGASIIAMAANKVIMCPGSCMMIHNPISCVYGDSEEFKKVAEILEMFRDSIVDIYETKTGLARDTIIDMMNRESYMNAQTAKSFGFADEVLNEPEPEPESESEPENKSTIPAINFLPIKNKISAQNKHEQAIDLMAGFINGKRNH